MLAQDTVRRKRDGLPLTADQIHHFVRGLVDGSWSEGQVAALAMAIFWHGMGRDECMALTHAMAHSGRTMAWADLPGPVLDKHSTGGVGDKISLMLAPMVAACGGYVPMVSGRGLGHTGGTIDKLTSLAGYNTTPSPALFDHVVRNVGCAIMGQTDDIAPADRRLYAIRDVTATVESVPLITASILSKKLAAGLQGLVMDVKCGNGAFAADRAQADALAHSIGTVAAAMGLPTAVLITDMNQILGTSVGNALEITEALNYLCNTGPGRDARLHAITLALGAQMLVLGGLAANAAEATSKLQAALDSGAAAERFARMVHALGGPSTLLERPTEHLALAPICVPVPAPHSGVLQTMDTRAIGMASIALGGGRRHSQDSIDPRVGFDQVRPLGFAVQAGEPLARVHAADVASAARAVRAYAAACTITAPSGSSAGPHQPGPPVLWHAKFPVPD